MKTDNEIKIVEIESNQSIIKEKGKDKDKEKDKENKICYICQEKPTDPINPSGCNHIFCRTHLKVI